ncbi:MAG TPA: PEP/pyruvate-binding domain-containing protein [Capillimicrobium sp.]|nr:PEP/pyruvate-binding domain-containing protein [Capillimicrobium sp.]
MSAALHSDAPAVLALDEIDAARADACGPKIANLAQLARDGIHVPDGFAVTTDAYRDHLERTGLGAAIDADLAALPATPAPGAAHAVAERIAARFAGEPLSPALAGAIGAAYEALGARLGRPAPLVAVRSSATGEDGAQASFAGQHETVLGVAGADAVIDAVRCCWASLFGARAVDYRRRLGLHHDDLPMAVGVVELVPARAAGVAFSIHPVTGRADRVVVEATFGWGEALVQGHVTPDHVEVGKTDGRVLAYEVADKRVVSRLEPGRGVVEAEMPPERRRARVLDDVEAAAIAAAVARIEAACGHPVDVEWVLAEGRAPGGPVSIVQVRPETVHAPQAAAQTPTFDLAALAMKHAFGRRP